MLADRPRRVRRPELPVCVEFINTRKPHHSRTKTKQKRHVFQLHAMFRDTLKRHPTIKMVAWQVCATEGVPSAVSCRSTPRDRESDWWACTCSIAASRSLLRAVFIQRRTTPVDSSSRLQQWFGGLPGESKKNKLEANQANRQLSKLINHHQTVHDLYAFQVTWWIILYFKGY